ncbi:MAG: hypothetical protein LBM41_06085 [Ruminococcus sp.]|jgi:hypothetical protein|nr:hypothetical protein [Ruminococcus sp.]
MFLFEQKVKKLPPKEAQKLIYKRLLKIFKAAGVKSDILNYFENYEEQFRKTYPAFKDSYEILRISVLTEFADYTPTIIDLNFELRALKFAGKVLSYNRFRRFNRYFNHLIVRLKGGNVL